MSEMNNEQINGDFRIELEKLINRYSMDNYCETPDFILADLVSDFLRINKCAVERREAWHGRALSGVSKPESKGGE